jgi:hypothetical protein
MIMEAIHSENLVRWTEMINKGIYPILGVVLDNQNAFSTQTLNQNFNRWGKKPRSVFVIIGVGVAI